MAHQIIKHIPVKLALVLMGTAGILTACYWDSEEELYGNIPCNPSNVSYQNDVQPILMLNCYECHSAVNAPNDGDGLNLEGYVNFALYTQNDADILLGAIKHDGTAEPMPEDGPRLDLCSIQKIETWISEGRQNN